LGQQARLGAGRLSLRPRAPPEQPGEAWGPPHRGTRRGGTEDPRVVLHEEQVSTAYGTVEGFPKKPRLRGKRADMLTGGRRDVRDGEE
jgi:hypothetical protein